MLYTLLAGFTPFALESNAQLNQKVSDMVKILTKPDFTNEICWYNIMEQSNDIIQILSRKING